MSVGIHYPVSIATNNVFIVTCQQPTATNSVLHLTPSMTHQCRAMLAFIQRYAWSDIAIVATTNSGSDDFIAALNHLTYKSTVSGVHE